VIKEVRWPGWVWAGECFFWYRPTRVVRDKRPLNGCCCCCTLTRKIIVWKMWIRWGLLSVVSHSFLKVCTCNNCNFEVLKVLENEPWSFKDLKKCWKKDKCTWDVIKNYCQTWHPTVSECHNDVAAGDTYWFYLSGTGSPGSPGKRAVKRVCVCVCSVLVLENLYINTGLCFPLWLIYLHLFSLSITSNHMLNIVLQNVAHFWLTVAWAFIYCTTLYIENVSWIGKVIVKSILTGTFNWLSK